MKSRILAVLILLFVNMCISHAQISLGYNLMRGGDKLNRTIVDFADFGEAGKDKAWTFKKDVDNGVGMVERIISNIGNDTIAIFKEDGIVHYTLRGDTLFYKGCQRRRAYRLLEKGRACLSYPFCYGDSISSFYAGYGREENSDISIHGWGSTVADGTGILTDGKDTLRNVIRLHLSDDYTETYKGQAEIRYHSDKCQWFCAGYRYPVMESFVTSVAGNDGRLTPIDSATLLFLPELQAELDDADNELSRMKQGGGKTNATEGILDAESITVNSAVLSADGSFLDVNYTLSSTADITIWGSDITGNTLCYSHNPKRSEGIYTERIRLTRKPVGNVVAMKIQVGSEVFSLKVSRE